MSRSEGLNPIQAARRIGDAYRRYLLTAFPLADPDLARQFRSLLGESEKSLKGPYLEATPPFEAGRSLDEMVDEGLLSPRFRKLGGKALPLARPLYAHQEAAIRKAVGPGQNLVIATGTGAVRRRASWSRSLKVFSANKTVALWNTPASVRCCSIR